MSYFCTDIFRFIVAFIMVAHSAHFHCIGWLHALHDRQLSALIKSHDCPQFLFAYVCICDSSESLPPPLLILHFDYISSPRVLLNFFLIISYLLVRYCSESSRHHYRKMKKEDSYSSTAACLPFCYSLSQTSALETQVNCILAVISGV